MALTIKLDGKPVAQVTDVNEARLWLHRHCGSSYDHALRYEGYRVENPDGTEALAPYSGPRPK